MPQRLHRCQGKGGRAAVQAGKASTVRLRVEVADEALATRDHARSCAGEPQRAGLVTPPAGSACRLVYRSLGTPAGGAVTEALALLGARAAMTAPLTAARRHGGMPSMSICSEKLRKVRIKTISPQPRDIPQLWCNGDRPDQVGRHQDLQRELQHTAKRLAEHRVGPASRCDVEADHPNTASAGVGDASRVISAGFGDPDRCRAAHPCRVVCCTARQRDTASSGLSVAGPAAAQV
jgi:hypothetical protein